MAKILVVDDRPTNRQLLVTLLGYAGHELTEAADGIEALQKTREILPDLIITDILMPNMSGREFVQKLRADAVLGATQVIFYTASYSEPQAMKLAQSCNVKIVLPKPCDPERVLAAVNEILHLNQPLQLPSDAQQHVAAVARVAMLSENMLADHLRDLNAVKRGFIEVIQQQSQPDFDPAIVDDLSDIFSKTIAGLSLMTVRLSTLVQAGMDLLQERDPKEIVRRCFDAACSVIGSMYAAIGLGNEPTGRATFLLSKGIDTAVYGQQGGYELEFIAKLLLHRHCIRIAAPANQYLPDIPPLHPPIRNLLAVPIATNDEVYGWMYFCNRLGTDEFTEEDERVAATLALQLALLHENFLLYETLQNRAIQLQLEVAERLHAEQELKQLNETLEARVAERTTELSQLNRELEAFSYSVSHDLRAPLNTIAGLARVLLQDESAIAGPATERQTFLQHIETGTRHASSIIDALLRLSKLSQQTLEKAPVALAPLVNEVVQQLRTQEAARNIEVNIAALPDCIGDATLIKQVFVNLLGNAFKFTRDQAHPIISIGWCTHLGQGMYFVADNGVGFNPDHAERLFVAFHRDHSAAQFAGTGIGLSIVQRIVHRHGGRIWAESSPGQGATFYFTLG